MHALKCILLIEKTLDFTKQTVQNVKWLFIALSINDLLLCFSIKTQFEFGREGRRINNLVKAED